MRMHSKLKTGAFVLGVFCLAAVAGFFVGGEALALPPNEVETYFYSDSSMTQQVGWKLLMCDGSRYQEGTTSEHRVVYSTSCGSASSSCWCIVDGFQGPCPAIISSC